MKLTFKYHGNKVSNSIFLNVIANSENDTKLKLKRLKKDEIIGFLRHSNNSFSSDFSSKLSIFFRKLHVESELAITLPFLLIITRFKMVNRAEFVQNPESEIVFFDSFLILCCIL